MGTLLLLSFFLTGMAEAAAPPAADATPYVNARSVEAERVLARIAGAAPPTLKTKEEKEKWAGARLAWISLARLQGRDEEALKIFAGCESLCASFGPKGEWFAALTWACGRDPKLAPCAPPKAPKAKK